MYKVIGEGLIEKVALERSPKKLGKQVMQISGERVPQ